MARVKLTAARKKILQSQVFDATSPGPLLPDFQTVLDFVGVAGVKASGKFHLLPVDAIPALDEKLSRPLRLPMQRPQLRSHPYLEGLHLLLRASGLTRVDGMGAKARLVVDEAVLESWRGLNPTEQYFTLLEAWLVNGKGEMIGERTGPWGYPFVEFIRNWNALSRMTGRFAQPPFYFGFLRAAYQLALLDLFGLAEVVQPPSPVAPWAPGAVTPTPFGEALLCVFGDPVEAFDRAEQWEEEARTAPAFGRLQPLFAPYFPAWRNNLVLPGLERREGIFVFKASLGKVWRLIAVAAEDALDDLAGSILDSFDFDDDHLYEFTYPDRFGATVTAAHPATEESPSTDEVVIGELPLRPGEAMKFLFDYGDNWEFTVKLERIDSPNRKMKLPKILERHGKTPPQYPNWDEDDPDGEED